MDKCIRIQENKELTLCLLHAVVSRGTGTLILLLNKSYGKIGVLDVTTNHRFRIISAAVIHNQAFKIRMARSRHFFQRYKELVDLFGPVICWYDNREKRSAAGMHYDC